MKEEDKKDEPVLPSVKTKGGPTVAESKVRVASRVPQTIGPKKIPLDPKDPTGPRDPRDKGRWPLIKDKVCEHCGQHYSKCEHYKGLEIYCKYCGQHLDDVNMNGRTIYVYELENAPGTIHPQCDHMPCKQAFEKEHGLTNVK